MSWTFNVAGTGVVVQAALFDYAIVTTGEDVKPANLEANTNPPVFHKSADPTRVKSVENSTKAAIDGVVTTVTAQAAAGAISHTKKSSLEMILGAVIGALALAALTILFIFLRARRIRRLDPKTDKTPRSHFLRIDDYPLHFPRNPLPPLPRAETSDNRTSSTLPPPSSKRQYYNNTRTNPGVFTKSLLPQSPQTLQAPPSNSATHTHSQPDPTSDQPAPAPSSTASRDYRFLEQRLAMLEAQIAVQNESLPPYVPPDRRD
ncbi:hypothetical protein C8R43DRAFT_1141669 [Mycena crocata]|nr:hypothetical protein C8R43DRAFT_1141669 [Mycena crocata]